MRFTRRAEVVDRARLVDTFVDAGPLMTLLSTLDHQVLYGRRGTGKTHALSYLIDQRSKAGDAAVYVDLRQIGSTGGLYADPNIPLTERGTRLLMDTIAAVHDGLVNFVLANNYDLQSIGPILDNLADAVTEVVVVGTVEHQSEASEEVARKSSATVTGKISSTPYVSAKSTEERSNTQDARQRVSQAGVARHRVHFGRVQSVFDRLSKELGTARIWIVLDEWSSVPLDLQPLLADLMRRSIFAVPGVTVKLGAIEQRSNLRVPLDTGDYLGLEVGADITADVNLDDFMVFDNDPDRAKVFFSELLFKHFSVIVEELPEDGPRTRSQLVRQAFTQITAFDEFIRAAEGVPRDAINIVGLCAQRALNDAISVAHVRTAAKTWYQRDKEAAVNASPRAHSLLHWIIDQVIGERRARAFLLRSDTSHHLIESLFDARVLHILKKSISAHDQPGVRYDAYKLDYGCYVDLISTIRAPQGLFAMDSGDEAEEPSEYVDVPPDDYRSIRRAILDIDRFEEEVAV